MMGKQMDDEEMKSRIFYWLDEEGDFDGCSDRAEVDAHCRRLFPELHAAIVAKRLANRLFKFELEAARNSGSSA